MAKRKRRKYTKSKPDYFNELIGVVLVLLAILGIGKYGPVGKLISSFSLFLVGNLYFFLLVFVLFVGTYMVIKRDKFDFLSTKMFGIYLLVIGILVFLHQEYMVEKFAFTDLMQETIDYLMSGIEKIMAGEISTGVFNKALSNTGGGIIGALFAGLCYMAFDASGTKIVLWVLIGLGFTIFTGFSILDITRNLVEKTKDALPKSSKREKTLKEDKIKDKYNDKESSRIRPEIVDHNDMDKPTVTMEELRSSKNLVINDNNKEEPIKEEKVHVEEINANYKLPPLDLLDAPKKNKKTNDHAVVEKNIEILEKVLSDFQISGKVVEVNIGPAVTQYELELQSGTKVSKITGLNREIALALAKKDVRIQAPIPGKSTVGIEMPNETSQMVTVRETIEGLTKTKSLLNVALGKDIMGKVKGCEIDKTPHMLVAGATGSGKSVCINCIIISLLMNSKPDEVKLIMVDPKKVELGIYNGIPHLITPVVTDPKKASMALKKAVSEMERRYDLFEEYGTKNITGYNKIVEEKNKILPDDEKLRKMPYWVVIVDELADLMLVAGKEVEDSIMRITQMARAAGIHLIIATQRPSTDVITGLIKSNIPSRISFAVSSQIDSRTILDMGGAEKLLGKGDMLFLPMGENSPTRIQGAFISEEEIKRVVDYTVSQQKASYDEHFLQSEEDLDQEMKEVKHTTEEYDDPLYNDIVAFVVTTRKASASLLQRKFKLGYNRAARIIDLLEERGIIGPQNGSKPREVLVQLDQDELDKYSDDEDY